MNTKTFQFNIKDVSEEGIIEGYASTFGGQPDSYGDVIQEGAFQATIEKGGANGRGLPLLWQHNPAEPLGKFTQMFENDKGLQVRAELALEVQKAREAHALAKKGIINAFSIGWDFARDSKGNIAEGAYEMIQGKKNIRLLKQVELWEVSLVTFPANNNATIGQVKDIFSEAKTERQLERSLKSIGISERGSKYIISMLDKKKFSWDGMTLDNELLGALGDTFRKPNDLENELLKLVSGLK